MPDQKNEYIKTQKARLRSQVRSRLKEFPEQLQKQEAAAMTEKFIGLPEWGASREVLLFLSMKGEIDTHGLIKAAVLQGKRIWAPRLYGDEMEFHLIWEAGESEAGKSEAGISAKEVNSLPELDLEYNPYGLWEPRSTAPIFTPQPGVHAVVATPGLAFDRQGNRLGRGKAYYDKWLGLQTTWIETGQMTPVGIGFSIQLLERVPRDEHDQALPQLVIGGEHIRCS
ncbi:MAG: 5-formyltetrahydrofolate cyclo-ligase [Spirochaetaceae bacterium]|nr:5-formyltetrahydrofolate cyclo-ligase [Spirochaetaceae bacterium]MCF7948205.1 5-formyltetrahydrofolate cyclo-ligase [Spirochaetia bacterium]MCF7951590.1 5-formyltetrahydrofolate cyclo-ligase [Spirochaetaceae bacterium]